jgi:CheY-like chemotaxis protein
MRILVVEDNLINQQVAEELLVTEGAIVSLAANGQLGVEAVAAAAPQFDVVLMDVQMPVLDGYAATRVIRGELGLTLLPIVAMTANALASDRDACLASGMNEHVGKPFDMDELAAVLIRLTELVPATETATVGDGTHTDKIAAFEVAITPQIEGLTLELALKRMSGLRPLYVRTARDFMQSLGGLVPQLKSVMKGGDLASAARILHTLKGNAGTLGADALAHEASALEVLCQGPSGLEQGLARMDGLAALLANTLTALQLAVEKLDNKDIPLTSKGALPARDALVGLRELLPLLAAADFSALQSFGDLRPQLESLPDSFCEAMEAALQDLNFEVAHSVCANFLDGAGCVRD